MKKKREILTTIFAVLISAFLVAGIVYAVTTIGLNISTDGNLDVSGNATIGGTLTIPAGALSDGSVLSADIADGTIVDADVSSTAAIAGTKISPDFGSQNIVTTGSLTIGGGTVITKHLSATTSITFNLDTENTCTVATTSISGASVGDTVALGMPEPPTKDYLISWGGWISAAGVASLKYCTGAATTTDAAHTVRFDVWKH